MKPRDEFLSRPTRYALGVDEESGRLYAFFPVNSSALACEKYYELTADQHRRFMADGALASAFDEKWRRHEHDELLLEKPGDNRGIPV